MNHTAEVYLWGTRIGIIDISNVVNRFSDYAHEVGIQEKTINYIQKILEQNKIEEI